MYVERNKDKHYKVSFTLKKKIMQDGNPNHCFPVSKLLTYLKTLSEYVSGCPGRTGSKIENMNHKCVGWRSVAALDKEI